MTVKSYIQGTALLLLYGKGDGICIVIGEGMYWERLVPGTEAVFGTVIMTPTPKRTRYFIPGDISHHF